MRTEATQFEEPVSSLDEIASILAAGIIRLHQSAAHRAANREESDASRLEVCADSCPHPDPVNDRRKDGLA